MNSNKIISLYQKIICSLSCIEKISDDYIIKKQSKHFLDKLIPLYINFILKKEINSITLDLNIEEIINFCNNCYDKLNIFDLAEDVEYGIKELVESTNYKR